MRPPTDSAAALRLQLAQEAAGLGYWDWDLATERLDWDEACAAMFGIELEQFEGSIDGFARRCHPDDLPAVQEALAAAVPGEPLQVSYRALLPDGRQRHLLARGQALAGPSGEVERLVGVVLDVSQLQGLDERERRSAERLTGLAAVALALAQAQTEEDLTSLVIGHGASLLGADGGAVCVRDDERGVVRLAISDSLGPEVQLQYAELPLDSPLPGPYTARTGEPVFLSDVAAQVSFTPEMAVVHEGTGRAAWAGLPLRSADALLGSLLVSWGQPRAFPAEERELLAAFAAQTAQALDRIRTLQAERRQAREARRLTETLQRSLLTSPPQPDDLQVAVRYSPAAQEAALGGDWYDAFHTPDGNLSLVIGDCVGHDRQAAAAMATMRNLLRATAFALGEPPAAVLRALDQAVHGLDVDVLATALLAQVSQTPEQREAGLRRVTWSSAGHLPPLLHLPDGTTTLLSSPPDLLLGLSPDSPRTDTWVDVPAGATLLLCTDGLVERRGEDLDVGLGRLRELVAGLGRLPLEELCDVVLGGLLPGEAEDDVALLAVRFHARSEPAPERAQLQQPDRGIMSARAQLERTWELSAEAVSARDARRLVRAALLEVGRPDWQDSAELAVSEIVTNAVLHAHTAITLSLTAGPDELRVEVRDRNPALPSPRSYDEQATTGRGMSLVAAVTSSHGVVALGREGKVVWFTLDDTPAAEPSAEDLLEGWDDLEPVPQQRHGQRSVVLRGMPPTLWLAARQHHDALLRELALHRAGTGASTQDLAVADAARRTIWTAVDLAVADARRRGVAAAPVLPPGHPAPLEALPASVDLPLVVDADAAESYGVLQDVLDEAESLALGDLLLVRPGLPEVVAVRDWACEQIIAQLGGTPPHAWPGTDAERFATLVNDDGAVDLGWDAASVRDSDRGVVAADDANRIVAVSRPLADALGWDVEALVGRRVVALVPHRFREAHVAGFTRHLTTGETHALGVDLELPVLRGDGSEVMCSFLIEATGTSTGRTVYTAWITPLPTA